MKVEMPMKSQGFQSTRLMRGVTRYNFNIHFCKKISIHTPHARRDFIIRNVFNKICDISIHTPHARRDGLRRLGYLRLFNFNPHASCEA